MNAITPVTAIVTELVAAGLCGEALVAAVARLEAAGVFAPPPASAIYAQVRTSGRPGNPESAGAKRTRAWRSRREVVTDIVTPAVALAAAEIAANPVVSEWIDASTPSQLPGDAEVVTVVTQKEKFPPHPLQEKNKKTTKKRSAKRHNSHFGGTPVTDASRLRVKVPGDTALHFELVALHPERTIPETGAGGWWWDPREVSAAQARLDGRVVSLPRREAVVESRALEVRR
jgi:hypothetical protein